MNFFHILVYFWLWGGFIPLAGSQLSLLIKAGKTRQQTFVILLSSVAVKFQVSKFTGGPCPLIPHHREVNFPCEVHYGST